jgi:hypothetical protein
LKVEKDLKNQAAIALVLAPEQLEINDKQF